MEVGRDFWRCINLLPQAFLSILSFQKSQEPAQQTLWVPNCPSNWGCVCARAHVLVVGWGVLDWGGVVGSWQLALKYRQTFPTTLILPSFGISAVHRLHSSHLAPPL